MLQYTDASISCWTHQCDLSTVQISRGPLEQCKLCHKANFESPVIRITDVPCPYSSSTETRCDLLLTPAIPRWLDGDYSIQSGLHIGITDVAGEVLEFDVQGLIFNNQERKRTMWHRCIPLGFLDKIDISADRLEDTKELWNKTVIAFKETKVVRKYDHDKYNCLDFVLDFLIEFLHSSGTRSFRNSVVKEITTKLSNKVDFCHNFVIPSTNRAARFIALEKKLELGKNCVQAPDLHYSSSSEQDGE